VHLEQSLEAAPSVGRFSGSIVDVGSGGGAPGIPLAAAFPGREVVLLEATGWKCVFLESAAREFPNVRVVHGRAEEQPVESFGVAVAKALAPPVVALEWCLPLATVGGGVVLFVGPSADLGVLGHAAGLLGGGLPEWHSGTVVVPKVGATPPGFPRRTGVARKRPLI
jgi:16S rRNA (guanine527-N7)-methyltransferase